MSRRETIRRGAIPLLLGAAAWAGPVLGQAPPAPPPAPAAAPAPPPAPAPFGTGAEVMYPELPPGVQVVRLQPPAGAKVDVLAPPTEPVPTADPTVVGLRVGVAYQLRVTGLEGRPDVEIFPVVQVVGHLHRPPVVDPARFPIRVALDRLDLEAALDHGQLVTQVVYLEDPEQALPITLPRDEVPTATLTPAEDPAKVAAALGRVMAIVRIGARTPGPEAVEGPDGLLAMAAVACPFAGPEGGRCPLPCGPARGTAPPRDRTWLPRDEFLCDGGDRGEPMHFAGDGGLRGIDPRDAAIRFRDDRRPRVLPTNVVCIYSPRFAAVRTSVGPLQTETVQPLRGIEALQRQVTSGLLQGPLPLLSNQPPMLLRHRSRASEAAFGIGAVAHAEFRVLGTFDSSTAAVPIALVQSAEGVRSRQKPGKLRSNVGPLAIKTAEGAVVTGVVQGANQQVMAWKPQETAGVEQPPNRPGVAVIKRVSAGIADAGDVISFVIQYRNMGNVPISAVSVIDSLVPRLEYLTGSARGAAGTVFSADENRAGGTELRWDLPGALAPGQEGSVTFSARVR